MGIEIPEALQWVCKYVVGAGDWPEGDETAMRRVEAAWAQLATDLTEIGPDANHAIDQVLAAIEGDTARAISDRWTELGHGQGAFDGLIKHIETLADEIGDGAADIEHTKLVILASLAIFAVEMAILLAAASTGIGAPAAGAKAAVAQTVTRIAVRTAIKQLLQRLISKAALKAAARAAVRGAWASALEETALDLGIKAVQVAAGRRDDITMDDLKEAGKTALTAAATGAVNGAMGPDGLTTRNVPGGPEGGNPLANAAKDAAKETVAGVAGEVAGEATNAALNDREFSLEQALSPENLTSSAAAGVQRGTETLGENNSGDNGDQNSGDDESSDADNPPGNDNDSGDPGTQSQGQNQSQGQQPPATQPSSTDTSTQTQPASTGQQPPAQTSDTGDQPTGQQQPGQNTPPQESPADSPEQEAPANDTPAATETQQPSETGGPQPTETGTPQQQQPAPTDPGNQDSPQQSPETGTPQSPETSTPQSPEAGTPQSPDSGSPEPSQPQPPEAPDTTQSQPPGTETQSDSDTPGPGTPPAQDTPAAPESQQTTSSLNLPADPPPQQPTSSLNLGAETTSTPETGTPTSPGTQNTPESSTTPGTTSSPSTAPTTSGTPATTGLPTTSNQPSTTPPTTPGETTPAGTPVATTPTTGDPQSPATTPAPPPETTPATTSAAATATPTPAPPVPTLAPSTPADTPRTTTPSDAGTPATTPTGVSRNQPRTNPQRPGDSAPETDPARPPNTDQSLTTPETGPNTPGYDYNIYDPANHARFLADFSRPPIPTRPTNTDPAPDRDSATPDRSHQQVNPAQPPNRAVPPTPDPPRTDPPAPRTDQPSTTAATQQPARPNPVRLNPTHPNAPRPGDPIWNSPAQNNPPATTSPQSLTPTPSGPPHHSPTPAHPANPQSPSAPGNPPGSHTNVPGIPPPHANSPSADRARAAREYYRNQTPPNGRTVEVAASRDNRSAAPNYRVRRFETSPGRFISVLMVPVRPVLPINATPQAINHFMETAQRAVDHSFNREQQMPGGDILLVELVHTADPTRTGVQIHTDPTGTPTHTPDQFVNQLRHELGLPAETSSYDRGLNSDDLLRISNDIATANTPTRFDNPSDLRTIGANELQQVERPEYQAAVENALRAGDRFTIGADPRTHPYGQLINDGGPHQMGRGNNCLDCSLSALSSFYGNPQVSAPRWPDRLADGSIDDSSGEVSGLNRAQQWLGAGLSSYHDGQRTVDQQFQAIHDSVAHLGPGSSALIVNSWHAHDPLTGQPLYHPDGSPVIQGSHATVVVYPHGAQGPVWWDPQNNTMSDQPPPDMVARSAAVHFTPIPAIPGVTNAAPVPNQGTSSPASGTNPSIIPGVLDPRDRERLGVPPDPHRSGTQQQPADRNDQPGGQRRDRSSTPVPELVDGNDRRGLHDSDENRPAPESRSDLSPDNSDHPAPHQRNHGPAPVPDQRDVRHEPGELPPSDRQSNPELPASRDDVRSSSVVDRLEPQPERDMAPDRDNRLLTSETQPDRQDKAPGRVAPDDSADADPEEVGSAHAAQTDDQAHTYPDNVSIAQVDVRDPAISELVEMQREIRRAAKIGWRTMGGAVQYDVDGSTGSFAGFSGENDPTRSAPPRTVLPPVALPYDGENAIAPTDIDEDIVRRNDAENNMLEHLHRILQESSPVGPEGQSNATGHVRVFVEQAPCVSCESTVMQFGRIYPNVTLELLWVTPYPPADRNRPTL